MTQDEIIEIAKQVYGDTGWTEASLSRLEAFAKLIAAKEHEALAQPEQERDEILQAITDPENQPSQFGTVTLDFHFEKIKKWEDLFERISDKVVRDIEARLKDRNI